MKQHEGEHRGKSNGVGEAGTHLVLRGRLKQERLGFRETKHERLDLKLGSSHVDVGKVDSVDSSELAVEVGTRNQSKIVEKKRRAATTHAFFDTNSATSSISITMIALDSR